ncbi:aldo/keto reductase [Pelagicoccus sp. SDUM812003]|uniref:aldo/keto reductase n=1 Tax=Pelagicoccus sp. SDUM812003 TaxID=3041267 RepID=UPI00280DFAD9|nr:aldo/keto reductase [Pelagicoccus sp. SDUM812003]MDQ8202238.1 aldo/keto reductase [Pelagicoccus sp. SDUM812003]
MNYLANESRYQNEAFYRRCGRSGLLLPALSLGLWQNFGDDFGYSRNRDLILKAFDLGINHFDLANNYGPPPGASERIMGRVLSEDLAAYRDELIVTTKAGYDMWEGPYGNWGSRKHMMASLDQSLSRLGLDYVDIFYSHRPDSNTPIEETMGALDYAVRSGKALYVGISNYSVEQTQKAVDELKRLGTPCLVHQPRYNMFERGIEHGLTDLLESSGMGCVVFCPLAQGLLTNRYLDGIPSDSRAGRDSRFFKSDDVTEDKLAKVRALNEIAKERGQSLAQMALVWNLRNPVVVSTLIGASRVSQIEENVAALDTATFSEAELKRIDAILAEKEA